MHIEVENIIEHTDGSATITFDMDSDATQALLSFAIIEAIKNGVEASKKQFGNYIDSTQLELDI